MDEVNSLAWRASKFRSRADGSTTSRTVQLAFVPVVVILSAKVTDHEKLPSKISKKTVCVMQLLESKK